MAYLVDPNSIPAGWQNWLNYRNITPDQYIYSDDGRVNIDAIYDQYQSGQLQNNYSSAFNYMQQNPFNTSLTGADAQNQWNTFLSSGGQDLMNHYGMDFNYGSLATDPTKRQQFIDVLGQDAWTSLVNSKNYEAEQVKEGSLNNKLLQPAIKGAVLGGMGAGLYSGLTSGAFGGGGSGTAAGAETTAGAGTTAGGSTGMQTYAYGTNPATGGALTAGAATPLSPTAAASASGGNWFTNLLGGISGSNWLPLAGIGLGLLGDRDTEVTQTQNYQPPGYALPSILQAVQGAGGIYGSGGVPVTPFSSETEQALSGITNRALQGSPVGNAARDYATQTLSGGFLGANPYLDDTYNRAAQGVTNQVQTNFARAGRNPGGTDAAGVAADRYSDLANRIYGGAYENERQRMQQSAYLAPQLANMDYTNLGALANVGAQREALSREYANQPSQTLDQFINRINSLSGNYGLQTNTTPYERNVVGNTLSGSMLGSYLFPDNPWGAFGGALLGGWFG